MIFPAVLLLSSSAPIAVTAPLVQLTRQECPAPTFDKERGNLGDRAIISDDGSKVVLQCGDGVVQVWQSGKAAFKPVGVMPLFRAAQVQGIAPASVLCPWSSLIRDTMKIEADCDILDHDDAKRTYVLQTAGSPGSFVVEGPKVLQESTVWQKFGALLPDKRSKIAIVNGERRPELLQLLATDNGRTTPLARLPSPNLIFEDGEGSADAIAYSAIYKSIIVSFGGAFRVANEMTYVRAFNQNGIEQWKIVGKLPSRDDALIVGDFAKVTVFASGRYALMAKKSALPFCEIIDIQDGSTVSTVRGWPLATSRDGNIALLRDESGTLSLVEMPLAAKKQR